MVRDVRCEGHRAASPAPISGQTRFRGALLGIRVRAMADERPVDHCDSPVRLSDQSFSSGGTAKHASFRKNQRIRGPLPNVKSEFMNVSWHSDPISARHKRLATMAGVLGACAVLCASGTGFPNAGCWDQALNDSCVKPDVANRNLLTESPKRECPFGHRRTVDPGTSLKVKVWKSGIAHFRPAFQDTAAFTGRNLRT